MTWPLTLAVAKGRIQSHVEATWGQFGWRWPLTDSERQLWFPSQNDDPGLLFLRAKDIATVVSTGTAELGIVGLDVLREYPDTNVLEVLDLGYARCRVVLAGLTHEWPNGPQRVATKYRGITQAFFADRHHPINIVPMSGSMEIAPLIGLAPYIVDIVDTGTTMREHGLVEVETILHSSARLIANASHWRTNPKVPAFRDLLLQTIDDGGTVS